ncbi:putative protease with the C-terminal PDZ domain [Owenweeksia hongkongensis DSM 17368]|uniref:Putative protease with the C-terminal PDZ domain n=1 Tax=Owenweeksia hongkongensis (strain DSM 17368 / CIP 108786 / JCM 12287 / NRRL B-23963 / UST20020801) TaxID=926562 RepID=G8QZP1_OWEHD|nr:putative protease with the C-terminal PDZ domain [Owenweeksia hongkongensis]AEV33694.1 putative protease with the C-terminal PDZ domain [Owenweeksia hongkongensis DSM 17368]
MKFFQTVLFTVFVAGSALAQDFAPFQNEENYQVYMDLKAVTNDELPVEIVPPLLSADSIEFQMPRIVPGTYDVHNYGRFVQNFKALNSKGEELKARRLDDNRWMILNASKLYKITYTIEDTYDYEESTGIFEPAGTSVEDSVFLLNNFGFVGYLKGMDDMPFELTVNKIEGFYGSTSLVGDLGESQDVFEIENYFTLHDNPIMYCVPDTATRMVGGAEVLVSLYSPNNVVSADECMKHISEVLDATADYLGGTLPVEKYAVLIYCVPLEEAGSSYGALEHHTSTVLYMPEFDGERFYSGVRDITAHEFFHIITPLNIHSEMINDFNFIDPEMSEHIWLYEGVTEYNSHLVQARSGIYDLTEFTEVLKDKLDQADGFNTDIPLTIASKFTLDFFKDEYMNFYQKGALAGMCVDLKLMELSNGEYRLVDLLKELGDMYGPDTFFVDENLFEIITEHTYPEMREFFARHFEGAEPLPYAELFETVGFSYWEELEIEQLTLGNVELGFNFETGRLKIEETQEMDEFGKEMGWMPGDEIMEFNGQPVDLATISDVMGDFYENTQVGDKVEILVARPQEDGEYKEKKLKAKAQLGTYIEQNILQANPNPTPEQIERRKLWINQ